MVDAKEALVAMRRFLLCFLTIVWSESCLIALDFNSTENRRVMVVAGAGGEEEYTSLFSEWAGALTNAFQASAAELVKINNNPENTDARKIIESKLKQWVAAKDGEIWILLVGHGTFDGKQAKFNLVGNDVSDLDFQSWLKPHQGPLVFINTSSSSAPFIRTLSGPNRVIATATKSGYEQNFCRFGGYISAALEQKKADLDKDGAVSVLEAFLIASRKVEEYYRENDRLVSESALLDDNGDGRGTPANWFSGVRINKESQEKKGADGKISRLVFPVVPLKEKGISESFRNKRTQIENEIETLRSLKKTLDVDIYYRDLEKLFLELSKLNIKNQDSKNPK